MSYAYYNPNPVGRSVGDCAVRAVSMALGQSWEQTFAGLALEGFLRGDLPNADSVWGAYLREYGFCRNLIPDSCPDCYTVADFAEDHKKGVYVLSIPGRHVLTVVDGIYFDSWDSGMEIPTYYWTKEH